MIENNVMGAGSSQSSYEPVSRTGTPLHKRGKRGGRKRRRGLLRKIRPVPTTQPISYHSSYRHSHRSNPFSAPIPPYGLQSPTAYQGYSPYFYNNYAAPYYTPQYQPMMIPQQQVQPMVVQQQQQLQQYYQMMMQRQVPRYQPMAMPQQVSSPMFSPYPYSPYAMRTPYSTPYVQQQPQVQPVYNTGVSAPPVSTGMTGQNIPYSSPYNAASVKITDWTGGGKISPGFLGPPI